MGIRFLGADGQPVAVANVVIHGTAFTPEHLLRWMARAEDTIDALGDCARVLQALLTNGSIVDACLPEVLAAAAAVREARRS